ncbi:3-oxoacyl-[acyl-carrier-protein] reductase [Elusimicrobiota bacterium]
MSLKDKIVVVTGGTRGIGKSIVKAFALEGAKVIFTYTTSESEANELKSEIEKSGGYAQPYKIDIREYEKIEEWKDKLLEKYEKIDILINNAGITNDKPLAMMPKEDWLDVINTNLNGVYNVTKNFVFTFIKQKEGNIINISSVSGITGIACQTNYSASKGGIIAFTKSLAKEIAQFNIRVNAIAPGYIETDMTKQMKEDFIQRAKEQIPLKRFGKADEVAKAALFLGSEDAAYLTGNVLVVDGGVGM